jgi:hypothetical protein
VVLIAAGPLLAIGARPLSDYAARTAANCMRLAPM